MDLDGGTLFTQFSHFIDLMLWLVGDVSTIRSFSKNYNHIGITEFDDTIVSILEFESGAIGSCHFTTNSFEKNMEGSLLIVGEKGTVKIGGQYLNTLEYQNVADHFISVAEATESANDYGEYKGSMSNHGEVYKNVVDVLLNGGYIATNGYEGLVTVKTIGEFIDAAQK